MSLCRVSVVFQPSGLRAQAQPGDPLVAVAKAAGIDLLLPCGGRGRCGKCLLRVLSPQGPSSSSPSASAHGIGGVAVLTPAEEEHLGARHKSGATSEGVLRLGCCMTVPPDVETLVVDVCGATLGGRCAENGAPTSVGRISSSANSSDSVMGSEHRVDSAGCDTPGTIQHVSCKVVSATAEAATQAAASGRSEEEPRVLKKVVRLKAPTLEDINSGGDSERLANAVLQQHGLKMLPPPSTSLPLLRSLQSVLRSSEWTVTAILAPAEVPWQTGGLVKLVQVLPGVRSAHYGIAVDVGTTTLALHLCDLDRATIVASVGAPNPQASWGDDVMTRVEFSSKSNESLETLRSSVIGAINAMVKEARSRIAESEIMESRNTSGIYRQTQISEDIVDSVFVGNSVMESIFLGIPPVELGQSPFALPLSSPVNTTASEVRLSLAPCGSVHWLPAVAGHVGSDTVGVAIAVHHLHGDVKGKGVRLILDIGTNCELVLEHEGKVFAASSPTGPAFEGAHISCGMRATRGAIERVRIGDNLEVALKLIGEDWQTSDISQSSTLKASGICGSGIIEVVSELLRVGILSNTGKFVFTHKAVSLAAADNNPSRLRKHTAATGEFVLAWAHETTSGHELTITTRDIRAIQLAKAALHAGSMMLLRAANCGTTGSPPDSISNLEHQNPQETSDTSFNTGTNSNISRCSCGCALSEVLLAGAFGSYLDPVHATAIGMLPQCLNPQSVRAIGNAAGDGAAAALVSHRLRDWARSWAKSVHYVELAGDPTFQSLFVDSMAFTH